MSVTEETRRESYDQLDNGTLYKNIIEILERTPDLTARQVSYAMYQKKIIPFPVRQAAAPRLTELVDKGILEVTGKVYDVTTRRHVATYGLVKQ